MYPHFYSRNRKSDTRINTVAGLAKKAVEAGITEIVFDRGGHLYHGRVKAVAEAAREAGLKF